MKQERQSAGFPFLSECSTGRFYYLRILGVMNLLPLPALDGGRLVFLIIEAIRGKGVDPEKEGMVRFYRDLPFNGIDGNHYV